MESPLGWVISIFVGMGDGEFFVFSTGETLSEPDGFIEHEELAMVESGTIMMDESIC